MSTALSTILVLALFLLLAAPLALGFFRRGLKWGISAFYLALATAVAAYHLEFKARDVPSMPRPSVVAGDRSDDPRCNRALDLAEQAGIVLDRSDPARLVVAESLWGQVPKQVADALVACHVGAAASATGAVDSQVVKR